MTLINPVKLNVGEEQIIAGFNRPVLMIPIEGSPPLEEVITMYGREYVVHRDKMEERDQRFYYKFSRVLSYHCTRMSQNFKINIDAQEGKLPNPQDVFNEIIKEKEIKIPPYFNGFKVTEISRKDIGEKVGPGIEQVPLGHKALIEFNPVRYVPATLENLRKLQEIFGLII